MVVTKAGKQTHGLDRFFSSLYGKAVPGLCFLCLSLISANSRKSYPVLTEQVEKAAQTEASGQTKETKTRKKSKSKSKSKNPSPGRGGRPQGSQNRNRREIELSASLRFIQHQLLRLQQLVDTHLKLVYFLFDGELGHNGGVQMVRQTGMHLISKLKCNSALYFPYRGEYSGRGPHRKYVDKLDYANVPEMHLQKSYIEKQIETKIYQMSLWHKKFADMINVVLIVKTNLKTQSCAHVVLFGSDLTLGSSELIDYYRLRFQIEFNFRDAKQYWGLEDFMSVNERPVYNSANLAMFMVNVSQILIRQMRGQWPEFSVNDLKAWFRGRKYVVETLKKLPEIPDAILIDEVIDQVSELGRVNHVHAPA